MTQFESLRKLLDTPAVADNDGAIEHMSAPRAEERKSQEALIDTAKTKYEGVILYSPLPTEIKREILEELENIELGSTVLLGGLTHSEEMETKDENIAFEWVTAQMDSCLERLHSKIPMKDYKNLQHALFLERNK